MILEAKPMKRVWSRNKSKNANYRQVNDIVHERIHIYHPINQIIDTSEFQRLRYIKQLSMSWLVFPSADYCRFPHSLGVYALADSFVQELAESQPELEITECDQLCVCIAALLHDLGHGLLSHLYENFLNVCTPEHKFRHEDYSKLILRHMIEKNARLRETIEEYLDARDLIFIEELIDPPTPFIIDGEWQLKGRPVEKSFLYEIVSNKLSGLDVDKFDYFLRDSMVCNVPIAFSKTTIGRIRDTMKVFMDEALGYRRIMFGEKHIGEIRDAFEARVILHDRVYQHKTVVAAEMMMINLLLASDKHIKIHGDDGRALTLSTVHENIGAFLNTDDRYFYLIKTSTCAELKVARELLSRLERREFPRFICTIQLDNFEHRKITAEEVERGILEIRPQTDLKLMVYINCIHRGLGIQTRPIDCIRVYNERNNVRQPTVVSKTWFKYNTFPTGGKAMARIYAPFGADDLQYSQIHDAAICFDRRISLETENENASQNTPKRLKMGEN